MGRFHIVPYTETDGIRNYTDTFIKGLYNQMVDDGTAPSVFPEGDINSPEDFLRVMKYSDNQLFIFYVDGSVGGVAWLNTFRARSAYVHFCYFRKCWGDGCEDLGKYLFSYLINIKCPDGTYFLDVLIGLIPLCNSHAIGFAKRCGGHPVGVIPNSCFRLSNGASEESMLFWYTRECINEDLHKSND